MKTWIRSPLWDGFWVLSGLPIGFVLVVASRALPQRLLTFSLLVLLQTGHLISPIVLAWTHQGFRRVMLASKVKYVGVPLLALAVPALVAAVASWGLTAYRPSIGLMPQINQWPTNPYLMVIWVYAVWNIYHFGMQNFGVLSIYRRRGQSADDKTVSRLDHLRVGGASRHSSQRRIDMIYCLVVTSVAMFLSVPIAFLHVVDLRLPCIALALFATSAMVWHDLRGDFCLPRLLFILTDGLALALIFWQPLFGFAVYGMNHWLVAIGLSSHFHAASRSGSRWGKSPIMFAVAVILVGIVCFGLLFVRQTPTGVAIHVTMVAFGVRVGLGFVHFLYDRYVYKMSDERVRTTIGGSLGEYQR